MQKKIKKAICTRIIESYHRKVVKPIFFETDGKWYVADKDTFPVENEIFIGKDYDEVLTKFSEEEFFQVEPSYPNDYFPFNAEHSHPDDALCWSVGRACKALTNNFNLALIIYYDKEDFDLKYAITQLEGIALITKYVLFQKANMNFIGPIRTDVLQSGKTINDVLPLGFSGAVPYCVPEFKNDNQLTIAEHPELLNGVWVAFDYQPLQNADIVKQHDIIDDSGLIKWAGLQADLDISQIKKMQDIASNKPSDSTDIIDSRFQRLKILSNDIRDWQQKQTDLFRTLLLRDDKQSKKLMEEFVDSNKQLFKEKFSGQFTSTIDADNNNSIRLTDNLTEEQKKLQNIIKEAKQELETLNSTITTKKEELREVTEVHDIKEQKAVLDDRKKQAEKELQDLKLINKYDDAVKELTKSEEDFTKMAGKVLPFFERFRTSSQPANELPSHREVSDSVTVCNYENAEAVTEYIQKYFKAKQYSINDELSIYNYLTCVAQNFFTIFAGYPGVGKTTLAEHIGHGLATQARTHLIAVGRGWTSDTDILGYYNPLNHHYEEAASGLMSRLNSLQKNDSEKPPYFFILDEANLSPIEHYFAKFISHFDMDRTDDSINITSEQSIKLSDNIRFMATINIDHTTEMLSPRILDRVPIININPEAESFIKDNLKVSDDNVSSAIILQKFIDFFGAKTNAKLTDSEQEIFDNISKVCFNNKPEYGQKITISHRKYNKIKYYLSRMNSFYIVKKQTNFVALDYAIMQFLLPSISGQGEPFLKRLEELKEATSQLSKTHQYITDIIEKGKMQYHHYSFF